MKVNIISRESIKPSCQSTQHQNPHKLCLLDQIIPLTYTTCVLFYPNIIGPEPNFSTVSKFKTQLKKSLSETLNLYYPFSGRIRNDSIYVDDFDAGVPFMVARVDCRMSEYFNSNDAELLNKFIPFPAFRKETNEPTPIPLLAFQVNIFSCGGLALGVSLCHKLADGASMFYLFSSWAALCQGSRDQVVTPNFSDAALLFPPINDFPENISALLDDMCFQEGNYVTRTFFFSAKAVETIRDNARTSEEDLPKPTRNEAVSCFIWKHVTEASWAVSGSRKVISLVNHAVNIRDKLKIQNPIGNFFWHATAVGEPGCTELPKLVGQLKEAMEEYDSAFGNLAEQNYKAGSASDLVQNKFHQLVSLLDLLDNDTKLESVRFSNWKGFFNDIDFGWGKPFKVRVMGNVGHAFSNFVVLIDAQWGKGIEATVTLEEKLMAVLERDIGFLAFSSANLGISSL